MPEAAFHDDLRSLLLIDEFGKGTAVRDGVALLAALLRHLATRAGPAQQPVQRAAPAAVRAPAAVALRAPARKAAPSVRVERREVSRPAVKVAGDRRGRKV